MKRSSNSLTLMNSSWHFSFLSLLHNLHCITCHQPPRQGMYTCICESCDSLLHAYVVIIRSSHSTARFTLHALIIKLFSNVSFGIGWHNTPGLSILHEILNPYFAFIWPYVLKFLCTVNAWYQTKLQLNFHATEWMDTSPPPKFNKATSFNICVKFDLPPPCYSNTTILKIKDISITHIDIQRLPSNKIWWQTQYDVQKFYFICRKPLIENMHWIN